MLKKQNFLIFVILITFFSYLPANPRHFELQISGGITFPFFCTEYQSIYHPEIESAQTLNTLSSQTLNLKAVKQFIPAFNLNFVFSSKSAFGLKISKLRSSISGENDPVKIGLNYISRQPPTYEPREVKIETELNWPDSSGKIDCLSFTLLYFFRFNSTKNIEWRFYAGPTLSSMQIHAGYLCYSRYFLGGHSVLFSDQYKLKFTSDRFLSAGLNSGWQLLWSISTKFSLLVQADLQLFSKKNLELQILPAALINDSPQNLSSSEIERLTNLLNPEKLPFKSSYFSLNAGFAYKL